MGVEINFRHVANSIFAEITVSGIFGQHIQATLVNFNLNNTVFSGSSNFHVTSG